MGIFSRLPSRAPAPDAVRRMVSGKVLAWAAAGDGTWLAGTRDALHLIPTDVDSVTVPWERVLTADWDNEERLLTVERVEEFGHPASTWSFLVDEPGAILVLLRERVTASIVLQQRVDIRKKKGVTVIARRPPGGAGTITWAFQFDSGIDPADPGVMDQAEAALREAKESLGLG